MTQPRESCKGCFYLRSRSNSPGMEKICHYSIDTGILRGCPAESCDRYRPRKGAVRPPLPEQPRRQTERAPPENELERLAREAVAAGMSYGKYVASLSHGCEPPKNTGRRQPKRRRKKDELEKGSGV